MEFTSLTPWGRHDFPARKFLVFSLQLLHFLCVPCENEYASLPSSGLHFVTWASLQYSLWHTSLQISVGNHSLRLYSTGVPGIPGTGVENWDPLVLLPRVFCFLSEQMPQMSLSQTRPVYTTQCVSARATKLWWCGFREVSLKRCDYPKSTKVSGQKSKCVFYFIYLVWKRGQGGVERESQEGCVRTVGAEPYQGGISETLRSWPELKSRVGRSANWATQAPRWNGNLKRNWVFA